MRFQSFTPLARSPLMLTAAACGLLSACVPGPRGPDRDRAFDVDGDDDVCAAYALYGDGFCDTDCAAPDPDCERSSSGAGTAAPAAGSKRVFVTAQRFDGKFGSAAVGDQICQLAAEAALLGGTWQAWLSDDDGHAIDRLQSEGPWVLLGSGQTVFNNKAHIQVSVPLTPINRTEWGTALDNGLDDMLVWTGTAVGGGASWSTCDGWSGGYGSDYGTYGKANATEGWTEWSYQHCWDAARLYCFEG